MFGPGQKVLSHFQKKVSTIKTSQSLLVSKDGYKILIKPNVTTLFYPDQTFWRGLYLWVLKLYNSSKCQLYYLIRRKKWFSYNFTTVTTLETTHPESCFNDITFLLLVWSSLSVSAFLPISEFSYYVIRFLN